MEPMNKSNLHESVNNEIEEILTSELEKFAYQVAEVNTRNYTEDAYKVKFKNHPAIPYIVNLIKHREQALLDRVEKEVIGEDEYKRPDSFAGKVGSALSYDIPNPRLERDRLREKQRQSLTTLRKEYEG